jgi:polyisoprenoid-binding protein YceI
MDNHSTSAVAAIPGYLAGTWKADPDQSRIAFSVRQLGMRVHGEFTAFDITIRTGDDPSDSSVRATIELASVDTGNGRRDEHVRSATFLDVARHPTASYRSTGIRRDGADWVIDGELTLHGVTRPVPLTVAAAEFDAGPQGGQRARFTATALVSRGEHGIDRWTGGGLVVGDKVAVSLAIQAVRQ